MRRLGYKHYYHIINIFITVIIHQGEESPSVFFIISGECRVVHRLLMQVPQAVVNPFSKRPSVSVAATSSSRTIGKAASSISAAPLGSSQVAVSLELPIKIYQRLETTRSIPSDSSQAAAVRPPVRVPALALGMIGCGVKAVSPLGYSGSATERLRVGNSKIIPMLPLASARSSVSNGKRCSNKGPPLTFPSRRCAQDIKEPTSYYELVDLGILGPKQVHLYILDPKQVYILK